MFSGRAVTSSATSSPSLPEVHIYAKGKTIHSLNYCIEVSAIDIT